MKKDISKKDLRDFGLLIGILLPVFIGWILPSVFGHGFRLWTLFIASPLVFLAVVSPKSLKYPYKIWMFLGLGLGWINSRIILGIIFILVLQPISLIMKVFGYDPLKKERNNNSTYRVDKINHKIDLKKIF